MNGSGAARAWLVRLAFVIVTGLLLARLGPFGMFGEIAIGPRYAYWIGLTLLMWLQSVAALALLGNVGAARLLPLIVAALAGTIPTAFEVAWAEMLLRVQRDLGLIDIALIYGDVALLSVPLLLATHGLIRTRAAAAHEVAAELGEGPDWLLAKLRPEKRGRLLALESDDHYVRVRTSAGNDLVHLRLGDAVARLGPELGIRCIALGGLQRERFDRRPALATG